jgi:hypothetical protein
MRTNIRMKLYTSRMQKESLQKKDEKRCDALAHGHLKLIFHL